MERSSHPPNLLRFCLAVAMQHLELRLQLAIGLEHSRIEMLARGAAIALQNYFASAGVAERRFVGAAAAQRIVGVGQGNDASRHRDCLALQPVRITRSIPMLVMG